MQLHDQSECTALQREVGRRLQMARRAAGFVQKEVAALLGVSRTTVSNMERGAQRVSLDQLFACAELFGIPARLLIPERFEGGDPSA